MTITETIKEKKQKRTKTDHNFKSSIATTYIYILPDRIISYTDQFLCNLDLSVPMIHT